MSLLLFDVLPSSEYHIGMNTSALTTRFFKTSSGPSIWILAQFGPKFNVITMIESTKVPCPENFFFEKIAKHEGRMSDYMDM